VGLEPRRSVKYLCGSIAAVGLQRALDWAIGLPTRSTSALWRLVLLMPAEELRRRIIQLDYGPLLPWWARGLARGSQTTTVRCDAISDRGKATRVQSVARVRKTYQEQL
jgi:hypothetical protein